MTLGDRGPRRWAAATMVPVALTVVVLVGMTAVLIARRALPSDGGGHIDGAIFDRHGFAVDPPDPGATALRRGMVVQQIGGVSVDDLLAGRRADAPHEVGDVVAYRVLDNGRVRDIEVRMVEPRVGRGLGKVTVPLLAGAAIAVIGAYVLIRRPREPAAVAFFAFGASLLAGIAGSVIALEPADLAFRPWLWWSSVQIVVLAFSVLIGGLAHFGLAFPHPPRLLARRPSLVLIAYGAIYVPATIAMVVMLATGRATASSFTTLIALSPVPGVALILAGLANLLTHAVRVRRDRALRAELAIVGAGALVTVVAFLSVNVSSDLLDVAVPEPLSLVALLPLPVAIAYAVLRRGLFDVQSIVNRTIAYVVVTATLVAAYALGVATLQSLLRVSDLTASIPLAALVAVTFAPVRLRVQHLVDRVTYGRRDDPYAVLAEVSRGIQASSDPGDALQQLVDAVAAALRLPHVEVRLGDDPATEPVAVHGAPLGEPHRIPMVHHGIVLGTLEASPRSPGEPFGERDLRLLGDVATQAAVAAQSLRLTDALARSRARAVTAAEDERQRIRRDLHDGLGPALTAISLQLSAALDHAPPGDAVVSSLEQATRAATSAKAEVRRIIEGMTPAQLDRLGLMAALRALGDQLNADPAAGTPGHPIVSVDGPATLDAVAPEVEVGAYRIAAEAMVNAHRHSGGCHCKVAANVFAGELRLKVDDDGVGLARDALRSDGVGLASMQARVDALCGRIEVGPGRNGGTSVAVTIPAQGRGENDD